MADEVLELLRAIQGDIAGLKDDMITLRAELRVQSETFDLLLQEGRTLRGAVNASARKNVARAEVEAIHGDLSRLRQEIAALTVRVDVIEERMKSDS
jgi:ubiquinone biosynthesis protein UbiJ